MQDSLGATVDAAAISVNPSFLLLPSDPGPCFCFCHSLLPRGSAGAALGRRQKCQQGTELPGTFCLSSFLLSSLMDGPVWRGE